MSLLSKVTKVAAVLPPRIVMYAGEKFGKTSFATYSRNPIVLMTAGETGLLPLIESGRVPAVPHFPDDFKRWCDLLAAVEAIRDDAHDYGTLVIDTGNGAEQLCSQATCDEFFQGIWSDYASYGRGDVLAAKEWVRFLALLDVVRVKRKMMVLILHHAKVKTFSDPAGKSWDQWRPEAIEKLWGQTHKWADVILFGGFKVAVTRDDKAAAGESRYLRSDASGAIVAGNRYGLPSELNAAAGAANLWKVFADALEKAAPQRGSRAEKVAAEIVAAATDAAAAEIWKKRGPGLKGHSWTPEEVVILTAAKDARKAAKDAPAVKELPAKEEPVGIQDGKGLYAAMLAKDAALAKEGIIDVGELVAQLAENGVQARMGGEIVAWNAPEDIAKCLAWSNQFATTRRAAKSEMDKEGAAA